MSGNDLPLPPPWPKADLSVVDRLTYLDKVHCGTSLECEQKISAIQAIDVPMSDEVTFIFKVRILENARNELTERRMYEKLAVQERAFETISRVLMGKRRIFGRWRSNWKADLILQALEEESLLADRLEKHYSFKKTYDF